MIHQLSHGQVLMYHQNFNDPSTILINHWLIINYWGFPWFLSDFCGKHSIFPAQDPHRARLRGGCHQGPRGAELQACHARLMRLGEGVKGSKIQGYRWQSWISPGDMWISDDWSCKDRGSPMKHDEKIWFQDISPVNLGINIWENPKNWVRCWIWSSKIWI